MKKQSLSSITDYGRTSFSQMINMIELIKDNPQLILIPIFTSVYFFIKLGLIGIKYDSAMRKLDSNYNEYHSFRIGERGRMRIPSYLKKMDIKEIDQFVNRFNRNLTGMWISIAFIILTILILK